MSGVILMYHRIADAASDPWGLCVTPRHFEAQLEVIRAHARPMRLRELTSELHLNERTERAVVLSFDDGYADNLVNALPILERHEIAASVFVVTGQIGSTSSFWWDALAELLLSPGTLPAVLDLSVNGVRHQWDLGASAAYSDRAAQQHSTWRTSMPAPTQRHATYLELWQLLQPLSASAQAEALGELVKWGGRADTGTGARAMSVSELQLLAADPLVEIGSHTVTHPVLGSQPSGVQAYEIRQSKATLERILGRPVTSFSYPYGAACNYTQETVSLVRDAGFSCACATRQVALDDSSELFELPRIQVEDWDGDTFGQRLREWLRE